MIDSIKSFLYSMLVTLKLRKRTTPDDSDLLRFFRMLNLFLNAGMKSTESLEQTKEISGPIMKPVIIKMLKSIEGGMSLENAMRKTDVFPKYICDLIQAGREKGSLNEVVLEIVFFLEQKLDIKKKVTAGLFVVKIMGIVLVTLIIAAFTVIKKFKEILSDTHGELPKFTAAVINAGDFVTSHWYVVIIFILALIGIFCYFKKYYPEKIDALKFKLPIYGPIYKNLSFYRMTKILSLVLRTGATRIEAFKYAAISVDNIEFTNLMLEVQRNLEKKNMDIDKALIEADKKYNLLDKSLILILKAGQDSGDLLTAIDACCEDYKRELMALLQTVSDKVVTPVLLIIFTIVFIIYTAIMLPINSIWTSAQNIGG